MAGETSAEEKSFSKLRELQELYRRKEALRREPSVVAMNDIYGQCLPDYGKKASEQKVEGHIIAAADIDLARSIFPNPPQEDYESVQRWKDLLSRRVPATGIGAPRRERWEIYPKSQRDSKGPGQRLAWFKQELMENRRYSGEAEGYFSLSSLPEVRVEVTGRWSPWETSPYISLTLVVDPKELGERKGTTWAEALTGKIREVQRDFDELQAIEAKIKEVKSR